MPRPEFRLMVLGCGSHAGKSLVTAGLCRILSDRGLRVAPFKAQNMALNSGATIDGCEIGRAQLLQAEAARCLASKEMNPVLLKPMRGKGSQVIVLGRPQGLMSTAQYFKFWPKAASAARRAYESLCESYPAVVIEGAGSPAEVNLAHRDLANLEAARFSKAPWVMVCDIERGGAFASATGTLRLVPAWLRRRCLGVVFNKFRGDARLLDSGIAWLKRSHGLRTLGVLPYLENPGLDEEDSLGLPDPDARPRPGPGALRVEVLRLGSMANVNDLRPLSSDAQLDLCFREPGIRASFTPDLLVIPGSRMTLDDMEELNRSGECARLRRLAASGTWILGICGGLQMLGDAIVDGPGVDGRKGRRVSGLGLLPSLTEMHQRKISEPTECRALSPLGSFDLKGYEIHHGRTRLWPGAGECALKPLAGRPLLACDPKGTLWGTYLHGILDNDRFRRALLTKIASRRGRRYKPEARGFQDRRDAAMDRWASHVEKHLRLDLIPGFPAKARR